ncbi:MAG: CDP-alcohol phosphatidyltransferase family protein [Candidatus Thermoplasmatota archaeon]
MQILKDNILGRADIITLLNASCGFLSLIMLFADHLRLSISLIFIAVLADGCDGIVARRFGKSSIGEYLEAMADMASLSIAPLAVVLYLYYPVTVHSFVLFFLLLGVCMLVFIACVLRLAMFHLWKDTTLFHGLPASASMLFILGFCLLQIQPEIMIGILCILAAALVSPIRFPKPGPVTNGAAALLLLGVLIVYTAYNNLMIFLLLGALFIYTFGGPILVVYGKKLV